jgi:hypothetical protein
MKSASPTVSLSRRSIFIFEDDVPDVDESPAETILETYPETAATTSMVGSTTTSTSSL